MSTSPSPATGYVLAHVVARTRLSPSFIRVTFRIDPSALSPSGVPDEVVHLYFPADGESAPPMMTLRNGVLAHHEPGTVRESRNYTVRHRSADRLTIDFVDHGDGLAASWARSARRGDVLGVWGTRSWYSPPADTEWILLLADLPGVPAMLRVLETLPSDAQVHAIAEVAHVDDALPHTSSASVEIDWLFGGNGHGASCLATAAVAYELPPGNGYVWFAGEASTGRALRKHFRNEHRMAAHRLTLIGYWRDDKERWLARYREREAVLLADYERARVGARSEAEAEIYWDEILERAGL